MEPAIDLERFAALNAELDAGTPRDELCAREGIAVEAWVAAQETWLARLADDTARKRFVLTNQYNSVFVARRRAITHGGPPKRSRAVQKPVTPPSVIASPAVVPAPLPLAPPPIASPSIAAAPEAPLPIAPSYDAPSFAKAVDPVPPLVAPAFLGVDPDPVPPIVPAAPEIVGKKSRPATVAMPAITDVSAALPFKPGPPAPPPPAPPPPEPREPRVDLGGTTVGAMSPFAASSMALPFQQQGAPKAKPAEAAPAASPEKPEAAPRPPVDLGGTVAAVMSPFASPSTLPFQGGGSAPARPAGPQASGGLPFQATPAKPAEASGSPAAKPSGSASGKAAPSIPPIAGASGQGPRLTLEQFASLSAEIAVAPQSAAQIRARYGFDEAGHRAESEAHNARFNSDKALYNRYLELFQSYRAYVSRSRR
ncbi:Hypothetical protein A7982_12399 [Minicystis rosea]|nr:Hypothetical protein A7982_12399 [Minicystis rosea]